MKTKLTTICLALMAGLTLTLTACGNVDDTASTVSDIESIVESQIDDTASKESAVESEVEAASEHETAGENSEQSATNADGNTNTTAKGGDNNGSLSTPPNYGNQNTGGGINNTTANTQTNTNINQQTGGNSTTNTSGGNAVQQVPTPTPQPQVHAPIYKQQWVVDKAAWTESVPVYKTVGWSMCTTCGADITGSEAQHLEQHMLKGENGNWKSQVKQVQTGTRTVKHPEEGHWESVLVCGGCTGTH